VANLGAFGVLASLASANRPHDEIRDFTGLWADRPGLAALLTVFLLSLGGFPPTAGFVAKWYIFNAAVQQNLIALAVLAALQPGKDERAAAVAGWLFFLGIIGFCGALFLRSAGLYSLVGLAPLGGVALMLGWIALAVSLYKRLK